MRVSQIKARNKRYCQQQRLTRVHFYHRRERVTHTAINSVGLSLTDYL